MVKIFKEESSNEEKENNQSDLYSCDFSSVDSNMSSSFLSMISTSFMKVKGVLPNEPILFPNFPLYLENYVKAWTANHFQTYFFNTLYVSVVGLIVNLLISITMAYSFSRFQFPGKEPIFNLLLLTMMIPAQLAMISQYTVLNGLKLIDTYKGIWLLWGGTCVAGNTFFYRGFFEAVPKELEESMYLDGATRFQTLLHCIIPLSKPAIATQAVLAFNGYWSNLFDILTFTKSTNKRTLSVALQLFRGQYTTNYGLMFAASVIVIIPIIVLFCYFPETVYAAGHYRRFHKRIISDSLQNFNLEVKYDYN